MELDFRQNLESRFEAQGLAIVQVQVGHPRLRYGMQTQSLSLLPEETRNQRFNHVGFDLFGKTLADDGRRNMAAPEAGNACQLLIFLDQRIGLAIDIRDRDFDLNLALGGAFPGYTFLGCVFLGRAIRRVFLGRAVFNLSGAHKVPFQCGRGSRVGRKLLRCDTLYRNPECKDSRRATSNGGGG